MNQRDIAVLMDGIAPVLRDYVQKALDTAAASISGRITEIEKRISAIESSSQVKYLGVWSPATSYPRGSMVTFRGAVWHANQATSDQPDHGSPTWTLAVKSGRDGKDAR
jgi:hypothetical protein